MLNSPDWKITQIIMNCRYTAPEDPFAVKVAFQNRKTEKKALAVFHGKDKYLEVAAQAQRQLPLREYYSVIDEPKPIVRKAEPAPVVKLKGKKK
jgi:hypothetical protein